MKFLASFSMLLFFGFTLSAQSINPQGATYITFADNLPIKTASSKTANVVMEVRVVMDASIFDQLYTAGRYQFVGTKTGNELFINAPRLDEPITANGKDISEAITIQLQLPAGVVVSDVPLKANQSSYGSQTATTASITRRPGLKRAGATEGTGKQIYIQDKSEFTQNISVVYMVNGQKYTPVPKNAPMAEPILSAKDAGSSSLPLAGSFKDAEAPTPTKAKAPQKGKKAKTEKKPKPKKQKEIRMNGVVIPPKEAK